jgi:hypothetical protein
MDPNWFGSMDLDPEQHGDKKPDPDPHSNQCTVPTVFQTWETGFRILNFSSYQDNYQ